MATATIISVLNVLSGAVAFLISYYAYKNNRLVGSVLLRYISMGFLLLGFGLFLQAATERIVSVTAIEAARVRDLSLVAFLVYTAIQLLAYSIFAWGYGLTFFSRPPAKDTEGAAATALPALVMAATNPITRKILEGIVVVLAIYLASQAAIVVLLLLIVFHGVRVFSQTKSNLSLMVLFGFVLIFVAHVLILLAGLTLGATLNLIGNTVEFCGFVSLLFFLYWSGRVVR
ncbi:MAG: hypothetical protein ABSF83_09980 [Nitrososphaerales archaeon]